MHSRKPEIQGPVVVSLVHLVERVEEKTEAHVLTSTALMVCLCRLPSPCPIGVGTGRGLLHEGRTCTVNRISK
jgi:hypothetical protein